VSIHYLTTLSLRVASQHVVPITAASSPLTPVCTHTDARRWAAFRPLLDYPQTHCGRVHKRVGFYPRTIAPHSATRSIYVSSKHFVVFMTRSMHTHNALPLFTNTLLCVRFSSSHLRSQIFASVFGNVQYSHTTLAITCWRSKYLILCRSSLSSQASLSSSTYPPSAVLFKPYFSANAFLTLPCLPFHRGQANQ